MRCRYWIAQSARKYKDATSVRAFAEQTSGSRPLPGHGAEPLQHNSWDVAGWSDSEHMEIMEIIKNQHLNGMGVKKAEYLLNSKHIQWDRFYRKHKDKFFKDRRWLQHEIGSIIARDIKSQQQPIRILEVGCGVGNSIYPLLGVRTDIHFTAFDFSPTAISLLQQDERYDASRMCSFVYDMAGTAALTDHVPARSMDIALVLFAMSAIDSKYHMQTLINIVSVLKPGGIVLFRDYAEFDQSQLQFKCGRHISGSLYARGDGTLVHYFSEGAVASLCTSVEGLAVQKLKTMHLLVVNRKLEKKMMRSWIQGQFVNQHQQKVEAAVNIHLT